MKAAQRYPDGAMRANERDLGDATGSTLDSHTV
jgi:hypothetical protein